MSEEVNRTRLQQIYDAYRNSALNRVYYGVKLADDRKFNFGIEISIAVGTTGSGGIAGLAIWGTLPGQYAWLIVSAVATVLALIKPALNLAGKIENYTKLYAGYTVMFLELKDIVAEIAATRVISAQTEERYFGSRQLLRELAPMADPKPSKRLIRRLEEQINKDIPPDSLWTPDA